MHEDDASHVGIVCSLVIVREQSLPLVIAALVLSVKAPPQIAFELVVICAFLVHLAKRGVVKGARIVCQDLRIVRERESCIPLFCKLKERLRKRADELIVQIEPVIHAIVSDDWLLCLNHSLDDK